MNNQLKQALSQSNSLLSKQALAEVLHFNKQRLIDRHLRKPWAPSIKYSMLKTSYGPTEYQTYPQESSDSESLVFESQGYPSVYKVIDTIYMSSQYASIPCATVLKNAQHRSLLMLQNLKSSFQLSKFQEFIDTLPIKGFISDIKEIFYKSKPALLLFLKTDQPMIVVGPLHNQKKVQKAKSILGNDFFSTQLCKMEDEFTAIVIRGLDNKLSASQIDKIISYNLKLSQKECIVESSRDIIDIDGFGCMIVVMRDLELCEKVVISMNMGNLNGLQQQQILVNVHPHSVKKRKIDSDDSIQRGLIVFINIYQKLSRKK